jgi:hypothetical protein
MAKEKPDAAAADASTALTITTAATAQDAEQEREIPLSLDEFCLRLSAADSRVELIGAFHSVEAKAGKSKDVESAYSARFNAFINQPA